MKLTAARGRGTIHRRGDRFRRCVPRISTGSDVVTNLTAAIHHGAAQMKNWSLRNRWSLMILAQGRVERRASCNGDECMRVTWVQFRRRCHRYWSAAMTIYIYIYINIVSQTRFVNERRCDRLRALDNFNVYHRDAGLCLCEFDLISSAIWEQRDFDLISNAIWKQVRRWLLRLHIDAWQL